MTNFKLDVNFTNDQLQILYATGSNVVIAKPNANIAPNVAWQVFKPLQTNTISWQEQYGVYASTANYKNGANLNHLAAVPIPAGIGQLYILEDTGKIKKRTPGGQPNIFAFDNTYKHTTYVIEGLFQDAVINGDLKTGNAVSAFQIPLDAQADLTPSNTVYIWLQAHAKSNTVLTSTTSLMTKLKFGGGIKELSVHYDSNSGKFIPNGLQQGPDDIISHHEPLL